MRAQRQAPDGESSCASLDPSNAKKKMSSSFSSSPRSYCQRAKRCCSLEPVLEHCELAATRLPSGVSEPILQRQQQQQRCPTVVSKAGTKPLGLGILSRLRDGYVKLMNEVASGADFAGVSSFYGAGYGTVCSGEYAALAKSCSKAETKRATSLRESPGAW